VVCTGASPSSLRFPPLQKISPLLTPPASTTPKLPEASRASPSPLPFPPLTNRRLRPRRGRFAKGGAARGRGGGTALGFAGGLRRRRQPAAPTEEDAYDAAAEEHRLRPLLRLRSGAHARSLSLSVPVLPPVSDLRLDRAHGELHLVFMT
jgi:hypothetical protein